MKIEAFQTLEAVVRCGSFAAAAAQMNLTASAVSMQMKQLELYFGRPLFDRSGLNVRPMPLAREVCDAMAGGLHQLAALRRRSDIAVEGIVRLGVIESMLPVLLPGTVRLLRERYPGLEVRPWRAESFVQLKESFTLEDYADRRTMPSGSGIMPFPSGLQSPERG